MKIKKPNFWDNKKPNFLAYLLLPFTFPIIINNFFLNLKKAKKIIRLKLSVSEIFMLVELPKLHSQLNYLKF